MEIRSKLVGVSFGERQKNIKLLQAGFELFWRHESENEFDSNAILTYADPGMTIEIGHLRRELAREFVERIGKVRQRIFVEQVTGGGAGKSFGVNVRVVVGEAV
jgi:hypothetical protein